MPHSRSMSWLARVSWGLSFYTGCECSGGWHSYPLVSGALVSGYLVFGRAPVFGHPPGTRIWHPYLKRHPYLNKKRRQRQPPIGMVSLFPAHVAAEWLRGLSGFEMISGPLRLPAARDALFLSWVLTAHAGVAFGGPSVCLSG